MAQGSGKPPVAHSTTPAVKRTTLAERFEIFYAAYPNKKNKGRAESTWAKIRPDDALLAQMLKSLEVAIRSHEWTKEPIENGADINDHPNIREHIAGDGAV